MTELPGTGCSYCSQPRPLPPEKRRKMSTCHLTLLLWLLSVAFWQPFHCFSHPNGTEPTLNTTESLPDSQGRSLLSDLPREGRILNDEKISIKGFIPIVGIGEDSGKDKNRNNNNNDENGRPSEVDLNQYLKSMAAANSEQPNSQYDSYPQHVVRPEDNRFIGSALQGLLGNVDLIRKPNLQNQVIKRKSDCVCVPFYLCKNGFLAQSSTELNQFSPVYQQRKRESESAYPQLNERSSEKNEEDLNNVSGTRC